MILSVTDYYQIHGDFTVPVGSELILDEIIIPQQIVATKTYASGGMGGGLPTRPATFTRFKGVGFFNVLTLQFNFEFEPGIQSDKTINWIDTSVSDT